MTGIILSSVELAALPGPESPIRSRRTDHRILTEDSRAVSMDAAFAKVFLAVLRWAKAPFRLSETRSRTDSRDPANSS